MRLVLHIGTEKTGTTAFQNWCNTNAPALRLQGLWYAQSLGLPDHRAISVMARDPDKFEDGFRLFGIRTALDHAAFVQDRRALFEADVAAARAAGASVFLISSEHCHSRLLTPQMVARVSGIVAPLFDEIEIVCFLRPQVDVGLSATSTAARVGSRVGPGVLDRIRPKNPYYDYEALLDRWAAAFGSERLTVVPHRRNKSTVQWFADHLGLDTAGLEPVKRVNQSLDYRAVAMMNALAGPNGERTLSDLPAIMRPTHLDDLPCEEPLSFSRAEAEEVQARFAKMNAALAARWPALKPDDLEPDFSRYPDVGNLGQLETADAGYIFAHVIGRANADLAFSRAKIALLESREAERDGKYDRAVTLMDRGIARLRLAAEFEMLRPWAENQIHTFTERREKLVRLLNGRRSA